MQDRDNFRCVIHRKGGLGGKCKIGIFRRIDGAGILGGFDKCDLIGGNLAHRAFHLGVSGVANQQHMPFVAGVATCLDMHFCNKGAGGIHRNHIAAFGLICDSA